MSASTFILIFIVIVVAALAVAAVLFLNSGNRSLRFDSGAPSGGGSAAGGIAGAVSRAAAGKDTPPDKMFKGRLRGLGVFSGSIIGVLVARLWAMQINNSEYYSEQADVNRTRTITTIAPRGRILDRNGVEIVTNRPSLTVVAKSDVADDTVELNVLANLLGMPAIAAKRKITDSSVSAQSLRTVSIDVERSTVAFIQEHADAFAGVSIEERTQRSYPYGECACHVVGYTGTVTTEQIEESQSNDSGITYENGDTTGQAGIEYQYEQVLQGVRGEQTVYVDANGNITNYSTSVPAESGSDIMLTLDLTLQQATEEALAGGIERGYRQDSECNSGAAICIDVTNGEILAMASAPTFRPDLFVGGISQDDWDALSDEKKGYPMLNRAISGSYPAASTIKPLSTFAALDYGIATKDSSYVCNGWWTGFGEADGKYCWLHTGHGGISLRDGIVNSCDSVFYEIAKSFYNSDHQDGLQTTFRNWGLGQLTGVDLPSETEGRVPDAEWKWNYFTDWSDVDRTWNGGDMTNIVIGQGDILVTTLQMVCAYMGIANSGTIWKPHLLKGVLGRSDADTLLEYEPTPHLQPTESQEDYDLVHDALAGMPYEESENIALHFNNLSVRVAAKTGSGEHGTGAATAWMIAYAPADDPKYVVGCTIEKGGYGSTSALYVVRDILGAIYNEPDTYTDVQISAQAD